MNLLWIKGIPLKLMSRPSHHVPSVTKKFQIRKRMSNHLGEPLPGYFDANDQKFLSTSLTKSPFNAIIVYDYCSIWLIPLFQPLSKKLILIHAYTSSLALVLLKHVTLSWLWVNILQQCQFRQSLAWYLPKYQNLSRPSRLDMIAFHSSGMALYITNDLNTCITWLQLFRGWFCMFLIMISCKKINNRGKFH